jgi:tripartite-type tricarboxylate transporter receptor subunit TctC
MGHEGVKASQRHLFCLAVGAAALPTVSRIARTQTYPSRPVHITVTVPGGSGPDTIARIVGQGLSDRLGQPFIVENRPGAAANIGIEYVGRAAPDGYELLLITASALTNATLYKNRSFNLIRDIAPVASIGRTRFVMVVTPSMPVKTVPEFIAYAKANPGKINMASNGVGGSNHVFGALFQMMTGIELVHVPYRTSLMPDLLSGQVQVYFGPTTSAIAILHRLSLPHLASPIQRFQVAHYSILRADHRTRSE